MADGTDFVKVIKEIAVNAVNAGKPCCIVFGRVTEIIKDSSGEVIDVKVYINDKATLDIFFLLFGERLTKNNLAEGDKLILLRQAGGQLFYVLDKCEGDDSDAS